MTGVLVITGASRGIGAAIRFLLSEGASHMVGVNVTDSGGR